MALDIAACGLEGPINLQLGAVSPSRRVSERDCGSWLVGLKPSLFLGLRR